MGKPKLSVKGLFLHSKIKNKILAISGVFLLTLLALAGIALVSSTSINGELQLTNSDLIPGMEAAHQLKADLLTLRLNETRYLSATDPVQKAEIRTKEIMPTLSRIQDIENKYEKLINSNKEKSLFHMYNLSFSKYRNIMQKAEGGNQEAALAVLNKSSLRAFADARASLEELAKFNSETSERESLKSEALFRLLLFILSVITSFAILGGVALSLWFASLIGKPVSSIREATELIAKGDLSHEIETIEMNDELGDLTRLLQTMAQNLKQLIGQIQSNAVIVSDSADNLLRTTSQMDDSAKELTTLAVTSSRITSELTENIQTVAEAAQQSSCSVQEVSSLSEKEAQNNASITKAIDDMAKSMGVIADSTQEMSQTVNAVVEAVREMTDFQSGIHQNSVHASQIAQQAELAVEDNKKTIGSLEQKAAQIGGIVEIIQDFSSQINLLSLNATIEAATAGEYGKGFAVVANEVKELAKQSADATKNIRTLIEDMQSSTLEAIQANDQITSVITEISRSNQTIAQLTESQGETISGIEHRISSSAKGLMGISNTTNDISQYVKDVAEQVQESFSRIREITENLQNISGHSSEIAGSIDTASKRTLVISQSTSQVEQTARETAEGITGIQQTASSLTTLSSELKQLVGSFKV